MLAELHIRDLVLIEEVELEFGQGLGVITGETGSGKSLLVGALELLLGGRPRGETGQWIRSDAREARIDGRFVITEAEQAARLRYLLAEKLPALLEEWDAMCAEGSCELILSRTLGRDGRSKAHVGHRPVPLRSLREIAAELLEIHGQHDHQRVFDPSEQLDLFDAFGRLGGERADYRKARATWLACRTALESHELESRERGERLDYLRFLLDELERLGLVEGERERLVEERALLRRATEIEVEVGEVTRLLSEGEETALDKLRGAERVIERWARELSDLTGAREAISAARVHLEDGAAELVSFVERVEANPERLELAEERLAHIERLERKHNTDFAGLIERRDELSDEIAELEGSERDAAELAIDLERAERALTSEGVSLSQHRTSLCEPLAQAVAASLEELGLAAAAFTVELCSRAATSGSTDERHGPDGCESVEFLFAPNTGEPPRPLRHIASGGEASRILLALRTALSACEPGRTLVFDEIDAGVGGRLGPRVGRHLKALAESHQVLCVTHLPAIAAAADCHLGVMKLTRGGETTTRIVPLEGDGREQEVAAMIAGGAEESTARAEARRLLQDA